MEKVIQITAENEIGVYQFPKGSWEERNTVLQKLIGPKCSLYECVRPHRLYQEFGGAEVCMLVDEDGYYQNLEINLTGSWLYGTDLHGAPIVGTILIVGELITREGAVLAGIPEEEFYPLYEQLKTLVDYANGTKSEKERETGKPFQREKRQ